MCKLREFSGTRPVCFAYCMPPITLHLCIIVCYHMHTSVWVCADFSF